MTTGQFASVPVSSIIVNREDRQRKELRKIPELAASIQAAGLINPPVVRRETMELVAGERRLTAIRSLGWTHIPVQWEDELDPAQLHLIELEENVQREQLDWKDECLAVQEYHALRLSMDPQWDATKTAEYLNQSKQSISDKLRVAREISAGNERVLDAPKYSTARGITQRTEERKTASVLQQIKATSPGPEREAPVKTVPLLNEDFHEWSAAYTGQPFNFLHCDFPYGVNADKHNQGQAAAQGGYADGPEVYFNLLDTLARGMDNIVAPSAHLMFWFSMDYYTNTLEALENMGWVVNPFPLVWVKNDNTGILPDPNRGPRRGYETAFMASRGDRKIVRAKTNWFAHPGKDKSIHMSEKPVPMLKHFMEMFVDEHSFVLDPTAGSANSLKAATALGAGRVVGLERDVEFFNRAKEAYFDGE